MLAIYGKSLIVGLYKVSSINLAINVKYLILLLISGNIIYIHILLPRQNTTKKGQIYKSYKYSI